MLVLELLLYLVLAALLLLLAVTVRRQALQRRGGAIELSLRVSPRAGGRGWAPGLGRFEGEDLQWYRAFSLAPRPRRTLTRRDLRVRRHRQPSGGELRSLLRGAVVLECDSSGSDVELAMDDGAVTGFLAWLEAMPPGATLPR